MRVTMQREGQVSGVAHHMGRCKPGRATTHQIAEALNVMGGSANLASMLVLWLVQRAFIVQLSLRQMVLVIYAPPVAWIHSCKNSEQTLAEEEHSLVQSTNT